MNLAESDFPMVMPLVVEEELFIYPFMIAPLFLSDEGNIKAADKAIKGNSLIFISSTRSDDNQAFYDVGVIGSIMRKVALPDGRVKLLFKGLYRGRIVKVVDSTKEPLMAEVDRIWYKQYDDSRMNALLQVLREQLRYLANLDGYFPPDLLKSIEENSDPNRIVDLIASAMRLSKHQAYTLFARDDVEERVFGLIDYILEETQAQKLQKEIKSKVHNKMEQVNKEYFLKEQLKQIQKELGGDNARDEEIEQYRQKLNTLKPYMGESAYKEVEKQLNRLSRLHQDSGDANILQSYIEWVLEIPFGQYARSKLSIDNVAKQLDRDHYSLEKPKERIIEYFAVKELIERRREAARKNAESNPALAAHTNGTPHGETEIQTGEIETREIESNEGAPSPLDSTKAPSLESLPQPPQKRGRGRPRKNPLPSDTPVTPKAGIIDEKNRFEKGTILCFYGPPGVGKTSLANSIAKAIKRKLVRVALGGLEDVNELRGHRRTYIGAMPGRITQGLIESKEMNPLIVLDEIDKVGRSYRGDPTSVLLEILDPEQNHAFRDYYTNFDLDLSQVIFIATANDISTIPAPLRDRMEFIAISSYTPQEKLQIAKKYLLPQELQKHGLDSEELTITAPALKLIIEKYTREAGVRNLRHKIAAIMRKGATQILRGGAPVMVTPHNVRDYLDKIVFEISPADKKNAIGVVNGLAWTSVGGDVLKIEALKLKGKGTLTLTGSLGDVMKESAHIAHSLVKMLLEKRQIKTEAATQAEALPSAPRKRGRPKGSKNSKIPSFRDYDIHLHVPEGATPKDGPSAGIAMACVIASILTDTKIDASIAMTGELTLRGNVLPIGGLKEKLIAAHKAGIKTALIPQKNYERDLKDIPEEVREKLEIIGVSDMQEVLRIVLVR